VSGVAGMAAGTMHETAINPFRQRPEAYCESFLIAIENDCYLDTLYRSFPIGAARR
jgi:hypothetical protein